MIDRDDDGRFVDKNPFAEAPLRLPPVVGSSPLWKNDAHAFASNVSYYIHEHFEDIMTDAPRVLSATPQHQHMYDGAIGAADKAAMEVTTEHGTFRVIVYKVEC